MSNHPGVTVAIYGATGAVGTDLIRALERAGFVADWRLFASPATRSPSVEAGGRLRAVRPLPTTADDPALRGVDFGFVCLPPAVAARAPLPEHARWVDLSGAFGGVGVPVVLPAGEGVLGPMDALAGRVLRVPGPVASVVGAMLGPLAAFGLGSVDATALVSAGLRGRAAAEELSAQVVSLFNQSEPPRRVFPEGLAFDLLPEAPGTAPLGDAAAAEISALLPGLSPSVRVAWVPLFAGVVVSLRARVDEAVDEELLRGLWADAGLQAQGALSVRRLVGRAGVALGPAAVDGDGLGFGVWAAADNLRACTTAPAVQLLARWLGGGES
jgi:aspartate-semialdehyde dehydrogenase